VIELLLDLSNIVGGFLLAVGLLAQSPRVGEGIARAAAALAPFAWVVGVLALATGGFFLIKHVVDGPRVFHYEVVAIGVGVALLWERLAPRGAGAHTGRPDAVAGARRPAGTAVATGQLRTGQLRTGQLNGTALLLAVFGVIAIFVGIEGLFTPN
jgi:hypothetical protein